jgi:F-type H+-transporting ATPase subunit b
MELFKLIDIKLVISHIVCFLFVLWLLKKFLWKPLLGTLEARRVHIQSQLQNIEDAKSDVLRLKSDYELLLSKVEEKARERIKEAEAQGSFTAQETREKARQEAVRIVEEARKDIDLQLTKTRHALKAEVVELVINITEKLLSEKLSFDNDRKIVETMMADLEKPE